MQPSQILLPAVLVCGCSVALPSSLSHVLGPLLMGPLVGML